MSFQRAARTDKGVSAAENMLSLKMELRDDTLTKVNQLLPKQIRVFGYNKVTQSFDCKQNCEARTYIYILPTYAFCPIDEVFINTDSILYSNWFIFFSFACPFILRISHWTTGSKVFFNIFHLLYVREKKKFIRIELKSLDEILDKVNETLTKLTGTHNFHNFTSGRKYTDPSAKRYIMSFECSRPFEKEGHGKF